MSLTSFVSSLFPTVYADAPAEEPATDIEEPKVEETPETSEEEVEEEEEPEPEDVGASLPLISSERATWSADHYESFSCIRRFERSVRIVLSALLLRSTICIARRRSIMARVTRERIASRNCELFPTHNTELVADTLVRRCKSVSVLRRGHV